MTGTVDQASDHARQNPIHAGDDDHDLRIKQPVFLSEQPMDPRNTDIVQSLDVAPHHFCSHTGFFRHGHVRSSRCDHEYMPV